MHHPQEKIEMEETYIAENQNEIAKLKSQIMKYENQILFHKREKKNLQQIKNDLDDKKHPFRILENRANSLYEICTMGSCINMTDLTLKAMKMEEELEMEMKAFELSSTEYCRNIEKELKNDCQVRMVYPDL